MKKVLCENGKSEMGKEPTIKQKVQELISEFQPVSCRGLSMNSAYDIHRLTAPIRRLYEEGRIKVSHQGICPVTGHDVNYYSVYVESIGKEVQGGK